MRKTLSCAGVPDLVAVWFFPSALKGLWWDPSCTGFCADCHSFVPNPCSNAERCFVRVWREHSKWERTSHWFGLRLSRKQHLSPVLLLGSYKWVAWWVCHVTDPSAMRVLCLLTHSCKTKGSEVALRPVGVPPLLSNSGVRGALTYLLSSLRCGFVSEHFLPTGLLGTQRWLVLVSHKGFST